MNETYYLSSLDYRGFEEPRKCTFVREVSVGPSKRGVVADLEPPLMGQRYGVRDDCSRVVITHRHEGFGLFPILEFPCFVFLCRAKNEANQSASQFDAKDLDILAHVELYRTEDDARNHRFD